MALRENAETKDHNNEVERVLRESNGKRNRVWLRENKQKGRVEVISDQP